MLPVTPFSPRLLEDPVLFIHWVYLVEFVSVFQGFYDLLIVVVAECGALLQVQFCTNTRYERLCPKAFVIFSLLWDFLRIEPDILPARGQGVASLVAFLLQVPGFRSPLKKGRRLVLIVQEAGRRKSEQRIQKGWGGARSPCSPTLG